MQKVFNRICIASLVLGCNLGLAHAIATYQAMSWGQSQVDEDGTRPSASSIYLVSEVASRSAQLTALTSSALALIGWYTASLLNKKDIIARKQLRFQLWEKAVMAGDVEAMGTLASEVQSDVSP